MMNAAVYRGIDEVQFEPVKVPDLQPGEALVRIAACGVCGTDLKKIHYGLTPPPRIFGHEMAGTIVVTGSDVTKWRVGDRVALNHHVPCLSADCYFCRRGDYAQCPTYKRTGTTAGFEPAGGGFAEYVRVMDWCLNGGTIRVPEHVSFEEATFIEPLNTCLKAIRMAPVREGDTVLVIGQGPIGLLFTRLAVLAGTRVLATDFIEARLELARQFGATVADSPERIDIPAVARDLSEGRGADLAIVAVPDVRAVAGAFQAVRPAGKVLLFAQTRLNDPVTVDAGAVCMQEKALIGSYSSDIRLMQECADLIFSRQVDVRPLITHRFPLSEIAQAIDVASHPRDGSLKVLVTP
jgi:L-iditol 2-dehydrogenase